MPEKPQPLQSIYPLAEKYRFVRFQTREQYKEITGQEAPPYNNKARRKYWIDMSGAGLDDNVEFMTYKVANHPETGGLYTGPDGQLKLGRMVMAPSLAIAVNIPPSLNTLFPHPGVPEAEYPMPVYDLRENEKLIPSMFNGEPRVQRIDLPSPTAATPGVVAGGFSEVDRATLQSMQRELALVKKAVIPS